MSLTGDPTTDALVPIAERFVGAVRDGNSELIDELLAEVITTTGGRCDPGTALAVVLAAMVPDDQPPSRLLLWRKAFTEYERLLDRGVNHVVAKELSGLREVA